MELRALRIACLLMLSVGCSGGGDTSAPPPPSPPILSSLTVSVAPAAIQVGQTATATAVGRDQFGAAIATGTIAWSSSATQVASITSSGAITGIGAGLATITASAGSISASASLTVTTSDPLAACRLPARYAGIGLGFPRVVERQKATGDVHVAVVFVDFSDAVATRTPQNVYAILSPTAANYFRNVSYGRMNLILEPSYVWRRMSKPTTQYGWSALTHVAHRTYIQEAVDLATASVDFANSDAITIISNPDAGAFQNGPTFIGAPTSGISADGKLIMNATTSGRDLTFWGGYWLDHEMGHSMGLVDLYAYAGAAHRFVGGWSLMGNIGGHAREYFAWERWLLGWIDDAQVSCATTQLTQLELSPVERAGGLKMIVAPLTLTSALVVESRRAEGNDTNGSFAAGVVVYLVDTSIASGTGTIQVLNANSADEVKSNAALQVGQSYSSGGVTITFTSSQANGDQVRIVR